MTTLSTLPSLFTSVFDRKATQFAWGINYGRLCDLTVAQINKIVWHKKKVYKKSAFELLLNEQQTHLLPLFLSTPREFKIHWENNNIPTKTEWDNRVGNTEIHCDFRISPCVSGIGAIVVLSWN